MPTPTNVERKVGDFLVSKTDTSGKILYCNDEFIAISGYTEKELLGKPHSLVRHPDMPRTIFKYLWDTLKSGQEVNAYVKNMAKDGSFYWVFANVSASYSPVGNLLTYTSVRRKPSEEGLAFAKELYPKLKEVEEKGLDAGLSYVKEFFDSLHTTFTEAMFCLQTTEQCYASLLERITHKKAS